MSTKPAAGHPDDVLDAAIAAEARATENLNQGKIGKRSILTAAALADEALARADRKVRDAVAAVRHEYAADALSQAKQSLRQFARDRSVLALLASDLDGYSSNWNNASGLGPQVHSFMASPIDFEKPAEWLAATEALTVDADAAFPEIKSTAEIAA